ncbi:MAG: TetR/AcrR family transcriptional regulator [Thermoleophilia bacterium]
MPEARDRTAEIVAAARVLLDEGGPEALSMRRIADALGIRAPSLYKHVPDKGALEAALVSEAFEECALRFDRAAAEAAPGEELAAIGAAYRAFARERPHLYRLMTGGPLDRDRLAPGSEERAAAALLRATGGDGDRARAAWAFAHGMAILELDGRFPPDADLGAAWQRGMEAFATP